MIIDNELLFADGTWAPTATGDNVSPNVWDSAPLGNLLNTNTGRDFGQGEDSWLEITVTQSVTSSAAASVDFRLRTDSAASLVSAPVDLVATGGIAKATLVAGYQTYLRLPSPNLQAYKRYLGVNANIITTALTAGKFHCAIVKDIQKNVKYVSGFNIDT